MQVLDPLNQTMVAATASATSVYQCQEYVLPLSLPMAKLHLLFVQFRPKTRDIDPSMPTVSRNCARLAPSPGLAVSTIYGASPPSPKTSYKPLSTWLLSKVPRRLQAGINTKTLPAPLRTAPWRLRLAPALLFYKILSLCLSMLLWTTTRH